MNCHTFTTKTQSIFTDNAGRRTVGRQVSGSGVDEARIALLGAGDFRVFKKSADRKYKSWHIEMMVDCSGSVARENRQRPMAETVTQLYNALVKSQVGQIGVKGINVFEHDFLHFMKDKQGMEQFIYNCRYGSGNDGGYGTHDGYFIQKATERLIASDSPGKILLAFSDGEPKCDHANCGEPGCASGGDHGLTGLTKSLHEALHKARKQGILALGIGIQAEHIKEFYGERYSVSVNNLDELFSKAARLLEKNIIRG